MIINLILQRKKWGLKWVGTIPSISRLVSGWAGIGPEPWPTRALYFPRVLPSAIETIFLSIISLLCILEMAVSGRGTDGTDLSLLQLSNSWISQFHLKWDFKLLQNFCCSVTKSCPTLSNPMDCRMPDSSVLHYLLELAQIHIHWVGDTVQPSHPLSSPSPFAFHLSQHHGFFQWVGSLH